MTDNLSSYAETIFQRTYAIHEKEDWQGCAGRVSKFVANGDAELEKKFFDVISKRKFIPGGRYLYSAGRELSQCTNCFLMQVEDSREGWAELVSRHILALSLGGGVGTEYSKIRGRGEPIARYGGEASGAVSLASMVNEIARNVKDGGQRRAALIAILAWWHPDIEEFITVKNWPTHIRALKEDDFNFPAPLDCTNISVRLDPEFFKSIKKDEATKDLYYRIVKNMCKTGEPGLSIDVGENKNNILRNPCQPGWATVLTPDGIQTLSAIKVGSVIWSGSRWTTVINKESSGFKSVYGYRTTAGCFVGTENHRVVCKGEKVEVRDADGLDVCPGPSMCDLSKISPTDIMDGLVIGDGSVHKASNNLVVLYVGENDRDYHTSEISNYLLKHRPGVSSEAWEVHTTITAEELPKTYDRRVPNRFFFGSYEKKLGFLRGIFSANGSVVGKGGGTRVTLKQTSRALILRVQEMLSSVGIRSYVTTNKENTIKHHNGTYVSRESYSINILVDRDEFFERIGFIQGYKNIDGVPEAKRAKITYDIVEVVDHGKDLVYDITVDAEEHTYWTGGVLVGNCGEITSDTPYDCCNLGSINLSRIEDLSELEDVVRIAVRFLYLGTYRGSLPHPDFQVVRESNRRIGLGLMGLHELCLRNDLKYEPSGQLGRWLHTWEKVSDEEAKKVAADMNDVVPVAVRAVAPTGTTSIIGETTSGIEPILCVSYKRRYLDKGGKWRYQYVVDPTAARLIQEGIAPDDIEDAYSLSRDVEKRLSMQVFVQEYTDQAIASTVNLPEFGEAGNNNAKRFSETLLKYLPKLRGVTVFPEGSRPGQPITAIKYETALKHKDVVFEEDGDRCKGNVCSI